LVMINNELYHLNFGHCPLPRFSRYYAGTAEGSPVIDINFLLSIDITDFETLQAAAGHRGKCPFIPPLALI